MVCSRKACFPELVALLPFPFPICFVLPNALDRVLHGTDTGFEGLCFGRFSPHVDGNDCGDDAQARRLDVTRRCANHAPAYQRH